MEEARGIIRFSYTLPGELDPRQLNRDFKTMGVLSTEYSYRPADKTWRLTVSDEDQAFRLETVLKIRGILFTSRVVASRFE